MKKFVSVGWIWFSRTFASGGLILVQPICKYNDWFHKVRPTIVGTPTTSQPCHKNCKGQMLIFVGVLALCLIIFILITIGIGQTVSNRIIMQDATDAACLSAATWQARGLNVIADLNYALILAAAGDLISILTSGGATARLCETIQDLQDTAAKTFPGAAGLGYRLVFKENIKDAECLPLPMGISDGKMFSLRVKREELDLWILGTFKLWMELDEPDYWENQMEDGPYIRLTGIKQSENILVGSNLLGLKIPRIVTVAQAMPYGNSLWNPTFSAKLVPVTADIPGIDAIIMH